MFQSIITEIIEVLRKIPKDFISVYRMCSIFRIKHIVFGNSPRDWGSIPDQVIEKIF